jgi:hypothetical protein
MKIFESGQAIERKHLVDEVDDMQLDGVVKTGTSKKVATNSNVRKPNSTLVLCALANYMVVSGMCPANIGQYESAVKSMENPIPGHILDIDGVKTFVAGEIPEVLAEKPILVSYLYEMPVKHNLHVNTMGKNYYGISLDEARIYKVTNDLFFVVDANAKQSLMFPPKENNYVKNNYRYHY